MAWAVLYLSGCVQASWLGMLLVFACFVRDAFVAWRVFGVWFAECAFFPRTSVACARALRAHVVRDRTMDRACSRARGRGVCAVIDVRGPCAVMAWKSKGAPAGMRMSHDLEYTALSLSRICPLTPATNRTFELAAALCHPLRARCGTPPLPVSLFLLVRLCQQ